MCAAESEIKTLVLWRMQQTEAGRLSATQAAAVLQAVAVQNLELTTGSTLPSSVVHDVEDLRAAAGTLEHPDIDLKAPSVERAQNDLSEVCQANGLTIGIVAQGG